LNVQILDFKENLLNIKMKREIIRDKIVRNDIQSLKNFIIEKRIDFHYINNQFFDTMIYAIENGSSIELIKYLTLHYSSINYYIIHNNNYVSPLSCALSKNNFKVANLFLNYYPINFNNTNQKNDDDIIYNLFSSGSLNTKNLNFILNHGYKLLSKTIELLVVNNEEKFLKMIFNHFVFDQSFILKLLFSYKNKKIMSNKQLNEEIFHEKSKIKIHSNVFISTNESNLAYDVVFNHLGNDSNLFILDSFDDIYTLIFSAFEKKNYDFIEKFISSQLFDISKLKLEKCLQMPNLNSYVLFYEKILFHFIKVLFNNETFNVKYINFEKTMEALSKIGNNNLTYYFVEKYIHHRTYQYNHMKFEKMFTTLNKYYNNGKIMTSSPSSNSKNNDFSMDSDYDFNKKEIMTIFLLNSLQQKNFDFKEIHFEDILRILRRYSNTYLPEMFLKKIFHHKTFNFSYFDFEKVLQISLRYPRLSMAKLIIDETFHQQSITTATTIHPSQMNIMRILFQFIKEGQHTKILGYFLNKIMKNNQWEISYSYLKKIILLLWNKNNIDLLECFIENLLYHKRFKNDDKESIKEILLLFNKINSDELLNFLIKIINRIDHTNLIRCISELQKNSNIQNLYFFKKKINL